jgi:hypothetical protein
VTKSGLRLENDGDQIETSNKLPVRLVLPIFALAMIVSTGVIAYFTEAGVITSRAWVVHTYEVRENLDELQAALSEMRASGELYLLTNDTTELLHSRGQTHAPSMSRLRAPTGMRCSLSRMTARALHRRC